MPAYEQDIEIEQGSVYNPIFTWKDADGVPIDLTGWTGKMDIRVSKDRTSTLIFSCSTASGNLALGGAAGTIRPKITATETGQFSFNWAYYDIELIPPSGVAGTKRIAKGKVVLDKQVTD